ALLLAVNGAIYDVVFGGGPDGLRPAGGRRGLAAALFTTRRFRPALAAAAALVLALGYGALRLHQMDARMAEAPKINVGLVQGNVAFDEKGVDHPAKAEAQLADLQERSRELEARG